MALNQDHITVPKTPFSRTAVVVAAETSFHNPTAANLQDLLLQADNVEGARIWKLYGVPRAAIGTANNLQLYKRVGSVYTLINSVLMAVVTPSASVANPKTPFEYTLQDPLELEENIGLAVGMGLAVANGVTFYCQGGFYAE